MEAHRRLGSITEHTLTEPLATTKNGTVVGLRNVAYNQDFFLGIPFAQPPVADLRYRRPMSVNRTWKRLPAKSYGAWCHSAPIELPGFAQVGFNHTESEDSLQEGGSADQRYNSSRLVQQSVKIGSPIIYVSFNYRLSGFGFLPGSPLVESGNANLGLYDQRLALHWIQENIAAFGGDPSRVTIQGESAGAISLGAHFLAFGGRDDGLFHGGIAQSGGPVSLAGFTFPEQQDAIYQEVLDSTSCAGVNDTLKCLRGQPVETLKAIFQGKQLLPVIDNDLIMDTSIAQLEAGDFVRRPLLIGNNKNEGTPFAHGGSIGIGLETSQGLLNLINARDAAQNLSNDTAIKIANAYLVDLTDSELADALGTVSPSPAPRYGTLYGRAATLLGDLHFEAGRRRGAQIWTQFNVPVYSYRFDAVPNGVDPTIFGAAHYSDIGFMFNNVDGLGFSINPLDSPSVEIKQSLRSLAEQMTNQWIAFATKLSPNTSHKSSVAWPLYGNGTGNVMVLRLNGSSVVPDTWRHDSISRIIDAFPELRN
ncbi:Alpha/Beta hydrolase protein [Paraphoma chrysanthemicola]|uniref:Carboxylic ester hydrolase n=1 Tax=Paraphoma chrysanthemicola TaxID=798071 RepID=A0A8K0VWD9_9PLEO|nr:Alpha/Beta hydrolase protein [Paraphoma chrysanthemicola]